jgi:transcriptional antiterminator NusG
MTTGHQYIASWYVIQTKPLNEDRVCQQFKNLARKGADSAEVDSAWAVEAFCPKIKCMSVSKGDKVKLKPLFPSYVFIHWDLANPANHHLVKYTRGVNKVLGEGGKVVPIGEDVIQTIKKRTMDGEIIEQKVFKVGDPIKVRRGHLKDLIGILDRPVSDSGRVSVLLNLFNRNLRVQMTCADISRA